MKSTILDVNDNVYIIRTDVMHSPARYTVMLKEKLTDTLNHLKPLGDYTNFEEALIQAKSI